MATTKSMSFKGGAIAGEPTPSPTPADALFIVRYDETPASDIGDALHDKKVPCLFYNGEVVELFHASVNNYVFRTTHIRNVGGENILDIVDYQVVGSAWSTHTKEISNAYESQAYLRSVSSPAIFDTTGQSGMKTVASVSDVPNDGIYQVSVMLSLTPKTASPTKSDLVFGFYGPDGIGMPNHTFHAVVDDSQTFAQQLSFSTTLNLKAGTNSLKISCGGLNTQYLVFVDDLTVAQLVNGVYHNGDDFDDVHTLTEAPDFNNDDGVLVDGATGGPRFMLWQTLANKVLGFIKSLSTTITAFRTGDVIPVDGPSGTAKMSKDDLLKTCSEYDIKRLGSFSDIESAVATISVSDRFINGLIVRFWNTSNNREEVWIYSYVGANVEYESNFINENNWQCLNDYISKGKKFVDLPLGGLTEDTGKIVSNATYNYTTGVLPFTLQPSKIFLKSGATNNNNYSVLFFDSDKAFISGAKPSAINTLVDVWVDVPSTAKYYAINCPTAIKGGCEWQWAYDVATNFEQVEQLIDEAEVRLQSEIDALSARSCVSVHNTIVPSTMKWENGRINYATGLDEASTDDIRSVGYISIKAMKQMVAVLSTAASPYRGRIFVYDSTKTFIAQYGWNVAGSDKYWTLNYENGYYARFDITGSDVQTHRDAPDDTGISFWMVTDKVEYRQPIPTINHIQIPIAAHKGCIKGGLTFGSPRAYAQAKRVGYDWIETDVQFTSDNIPVIIHDVPINHIGDFIVKKSDGTPCAHINVSTMTSATLLGDYRYADGGNIPTFKECLNHLTQLGLNVVMEFKAEPANMAQWSAIKESALQFGCEKIIWNCTSTDYRKVFPMLVELGIYKQGVIALTSGTYDDAEAMFEYASSLPNTQVSLWNGGSFNFDPNVDSDEVQALLKKYNVQWHGDWATHNNKYTCASIVSDNYCKILPYYVDETSVTSGAVDYGSLTEVGTVTLAKTQNFAIEMVADDAVGVKVEGVNDVFYGNVSFARVAAAGTYKIYLVGTGNVSELIVRK